LNIYLISDTYCSVFIKFQRTEMCKIAEFGIKKEKFISLFLPPITWQNILMRGL
jgi:hypothetical protein